MANMADDPNTMRSDLPDWLEEAPTIVIKNVSKKESFARGATQGASFGFSDEAAGVGSAFHAATHKKPFEGGLKGVGRYFQEVIDAYKAGRDDERSANLDAAQANPKTYFGGSLAGGLATAALPVGSAATIGGAARTGAALGAIGGVGATEDLFSKQGVKDVATSTLFGFGLGGAGKAVGNRLMTGRWRGAPAKPAAAVAEAEAGKVAQAAEPKAVLAPEEAIAGAPEYQKTTVWPEPTKQDIAIASTQGKDPRMVAAWNKDKARIVKQPSLDANATGPKLEPEVVGDLDLFDNHLRGLEKKAGELIEKSNLRASNVDLANVFERKVGELMESGAAATEGGQAAIGRLRNYVQRLVPKDADGNEIVQDWSPKRIRQFMQGLWEDNRRFYQPGKTFQTAEEEALASVAGEINQGLKSQTPGLGELMDTYSDDVNFFKTLQKRWKLDDANLPRAPGWFKNGFVYQLQDSAFGNRSLDDSLVGAIQRMGKIAGRNYREIVNDRMVIAHLFPDKVGGLDRGTATNVWTRAADALLKKVPVINRLREAGQDIGQLLGQAALEGGPGSTAGKIMSAAGTATKAGSSIGGKIIPLGRRAGAWAGKYSDPVSRGLIPSIALEMSDTSRGSKGLSGLQSLFQTEGPSESSWQPFSGSSGLQTGSVNQPPSPNVEPESQSGSSLPALLQAMSNSQAGSEGQSGSQPRRGAQKANSTAQEEMQILLAMVRKLAATDPKYRALLNKLTSAGGR